jgi:hypothetical protein
MKERHDALLLHKEGSEPSSKAKIMSPCVFSLHYYLRMSYFKQFEKYQIAERRLLVVS